MDFNKLIARVKAILTTPKTEWPVIAAEPQTVADIYKNYIVWLAAVPAICQFIKGTFIGYGALGTMRMPIGAGITSMVVYYALSLVLVYVVALVVDALAPTFSGQKNQVQALKAVAYSWTAGWIAGIGALVPWLGVLIALAGLIYGIYLMFLGLPATMKCPQEKSGGYTAVTIIIAVVLSWIIAIIIGALSGTAALMAGGASPTLSGLGGSSHEVEIDKDSPLGKLAAMGQKMEAAGKKMEAAQKAGDQKAQGEALGQIMGAALGGGDQVEALAPDVLKPFVPETLAGLKRTDFSAERNGAMGMQVAEARATYSNGADRSLHLEVSDMGSAKGLMALAGWAAVEANRETDHGYDKTYKDGGRLVHEQWDSQTRYGEFGIVLGDRFVVKVSGNADSIDQLKAAVVGMNLAGLEALKDQGVKKG